MVDRRITIGDITVNRIGLGTNRLSPTTENNGLLKYALEIGINFIDTAHLYGGGASEAAIGEALAPYPEGLVVATKGGYENNSPSYLRANLEESLRKLKTGRITLYQLHKPDSQTPISQSVKLLKSFQAEGLVQHIGLSNVGIEQIEEARQHIKVVSVQNEYSLVARRYDGVVDYCQQNGIVFIPYFPLRHIPHRALERVAFSHDKTASQIALAWLLKRSPVMLPIPGTLSKKHLEENTEALKIELTDEEFESLNNIA